MYLQVHGSVSCVCISTLEGPVFQPIFKNLNFTDSQIPDTKTLLWKAVWTGKQFGKTWTTMPMESGRLRHTEL